MSLYSVKYMDYNVRQKIGPWNTTDMEMTHKEWVTKVNKNIDLTRSTFDKKKKKRRQPTFSGHARIEDNLKTL